MNTLARLDKMELQIVRLLDAIEGHLFVSSIATLAQAHLPLPAITLAFGQAEMLRRTRDEIRREWEEENRA